MKGSGIRRRLEQDLIPNRCARETHRERISEIAMSGSRTTGQQRQRVTRSADNSPSESTFDWILRTSAALFAKNGYHATGIAEILTSLNLSRGSLYYHIESKEELLYEISRVEVDRLNGEAAEVVTLPLPAPDRFRLLARLLLRNITDHRASWTVFFREFNALSGKRKKRILEARDQFEAYWAQVLMDGVRDGVFREYSPLLVKGTLGMFNYTYLWLHGDGQMTPEEVADEFCDVLLTGLCRPSASDSVRSLG